MGRSISSTVRGESFKTNGALIKRVQELIALYKFGEFLGSEDTEFCMELFTRHPNYLEKIGGGVKSIEVRRDDYGHRYFHLHRIDGTDIDISWRNCVTPKI